jgi:tripartite-type tricarboxylate transporter receptor subunit TctC
MTPAAKIVPKLLICLTALLAAPSLAQSGPGGFPSKPVRVIVPAAAGSLTDPVARIIVDELGRRTGQSWLIDNRPGAGGMIGAEAAARSAPDGYTLLFSANALIITPSLYPATARYKTAEDFTPISLAARADNLLVASSASGIKSIQELVAKAKATPGGLDYTSPLIGSAAHLTVELFRTTAGIPLNHVAYKDASQGTGDTLSGRIPVNVMGISTALPHIRAGKIVPLAWTGAKRAPELPDTPTFAEAGYPQVHLGLWFGFFGPAKIPAELVIYLNQQINAALKAPAVTEKLGGMRIEAVGSTPQELAALVAREEPVYAKVVREAGLKLD